LDEDQGNDLWNFVPNKGTAHWCLKNNMR
jgi:hypothetical protein